MAASAAQRQLTTETVVHCGPRTKREWLDSIGFQLAFSLVVAVLYVLILTSALSLVILSGVSGSANGVEGPL